MSTPGRARAMALALVAALGTLAAGSAAAQAGRPIKVGAVSALTGATAFPESSQAAKVYFDAINAHGGIGGRRIEYVSLDERMDPAATAQAAARLVDDPEVVALVGSSGVMDCLVNRERYDKAGILSLQGASVMPDCFTSPAIVPFNNGPFTGLAGAVMFARDSLHARTPCVSLLDLPGMAVGYRRAMTKLAQDSGKPQPPLRVLGLDQDPAAVLRELVALQCDAVIFTGHEPAVLRWMAAARSVGVTGIAWVFLTPAYTDGVAKALAERSDAVYVMAEFEPWHGRSLALSDWRQLMRKAGLPLSSLSQGGYLSAQIFVRALRRIDGPINRASVTRALRDLPATEHAFVGMPFEIGHGKSHNPNRTSLPMKLVRGSWEIAASQWIQVPVVLDP